MNYVRQQGIVDRNRLDKRLTVVGAGAIGSFTTMILAKMGYEGEITVYDDDKVSTENLPNQFYRGLDLEMNKVHALNDIVMQYSSKSIIPMVEKMSNVSHDTEAVLLATDNMDSRIAIYKSLPPECEWLFDGRMGAELMRIYTVNLLEQTERQLYEQTLYTSDEAARLPCTARSIVYNVAVVSGLLANQIKRVFMKQPYSCEIIFDLTTLTLLQQTVEHKNE